MRESKRRRNVVDLSTFSAKVEELMGLYNGMTSVNQKKAAVILSTTFKDILPTVRVSSGRDTTTENSQDHATRSPASDVLPQLVKGNVRKRRATSTNNKPSEPEGDTFASLLQGILETVVAEEHNSQPVQQKNKRKQRQRRQVVKTDSVKTSEQEHMVPCGETVIGDLLNGTTDNEDDIIGMKIFDNACPNRESSSTLAVATCSKNQPSQPPHANTESTQLFDGEGQSLSLHQTLEERLDESVFIELKPASKVPMPEDGVGSHIRTVLEENGQREVPIPGGDVNSVVLGNGAQDDNYDDGDCNDLLDLELDIYNEPNEDRSVSVECKKFDLLKPTKTKNTTIQQTKKKTIIRPTKKKKKQTQNIVHKCLECKRRFKHSVRFKRHLLSHDKSQNPMSCRKCRATFDAYVLYKHHGCVLKPHLGSLACLQCKTKYLNAKQLLSHMRLKHGKRPKELKHFCKFCNKGFSGKLYLYKHLKNHAEGKFVCLRCGEFIEDKELYYEHVTKHERDAEYMCEKCGTGFSKILLYKKHMKAHERFECPECDLTFPSRKALFRHKRLMHTVKVDPGSKRSRCDMCPKSFRRPSTLSLHKRIHTGERPVECNVCKVFFRTPMDLRKHQKTNTHLLKAGEVTRERSHLCALCGQAYFRKYALQRHMKTHCEERPFDCPHCDYRCKESTNLKRHIMRHLSERNFICEICGASFHTKKTLETHVIYKHSSNKDYKCSECTMAFKTPNAVRRHMTSHSDTRPHTCWCGSSFNRMYNLRRHMKSVHGTDEELPPIRKVRVLGELEEVMPPKAYTAVRPCLFKMYNAGTMPLTSSSVTCAPDMSVYSPLDSGIPSTMVNLSQPTMQQIKVNSQGMQPNQNPPFTLTSPLIDQKLAQLPPDSSYAIMQPNQLLEDDKVAHVTSNILSELRESVKNAYDMSMTTSNPSSVQTPVPIPATTPGPLKDGQHVEPQLSTLASVGIETVLQDIIHRPTLSSYENHLYFSQQTPAPVDRKTTFIHNMTPNFVHDFSNFNTASLYGPQFYTEPQRPRMTQLQDGLTHEQLQAVASNLPSDLSKYHQGGAE